MPDRRTLAGQLDHLSGPSASTGNAGKPRGTTVDVYRSGCMGDIWRGHGA
jgi:hypothetical protein